MCALLRIFCPSTFLSGSTPRPPPEIGQTESIAEVSRKNNVGNAVKKVLEAIRTVFFLPTFLNDGFGFLLS